MTAWLQKLLVPVIVESLTEIITKYVADPIFRSHVDHAVNQAKGAITEGDKLEAAKSLQKLFNR